MSAQGNDMLQAALRDAIGGPVSLLLSSGATLEGRLESVDLQAWAWAVLLEDIEYRVGEASRETTMRHMVDLPNVVAVGVVER